MDIITLNGGSPANFLGDFIIDWIIFLMAVCKYDTNCLVKTNLIHMANSSCQKFSKEIYLCMMQFYSNIANTFKNKY